jgi:hypothetical protein
MRYRLLHPAICGMRTHPALRGFLAAFFGERVRLELSLRYATSI